MLNIGHKFEQHALNYLLKQGAILIQQGYRSRYGEIDLIVKLNDTLIFVEVRARSSNFYGGAAYSITHKKQQKIIQTAHVFLQQIPTELQQLNKRFDAILFEKGRLIWLKDCMQA
jgi:putative endonuclease